MRLFTETHTRARFSSRFMSRPNSERKHTFTNSHKRTRARGNRAIERRQHDREAFRAIVRDELSSPFASNVVDRRLARAILLLFGLCCSWHEIARTAPGAAPFARAMSVVVVVVNDEQRASSRKYNRNRMGTESHVVVVVDATSSRTPSGLPIVANLINLLAVRERWAHWMYYMLCTDLCTERDGCIHRHVRANKAGDIPVLIGHMCAFGVRIYFYVASATNLEKTIRNNQKVCPVIKCPALQAQHYVLYFKETVRNKRLSSFQQGFTKKCRVHSWRISYRYIAVFRS